MRHLAQCPSRGAVLDALYTCVWAPGLRYTAAMQVYVAICSSLHCVRYEAAQVPLTPFATVLQFAARINPFRVWATLAFHTCRHIVSSFC